MIKVLLIDNYDSYSYLLKNLIWNVTGYEPTVVVNSNPWLETNEWESFDTIILSPGPGTVEKKSDFGYCSKLLEQSKNIPILGICLGMQGIGFSEKMKIKKSSNTFHGKYSKIIHNQKALFKDLPNPFKAVRYHSLVLDNSCVPSTVNILATSQEDSKIMAISLTDKPFYGLQFHPESIGTVNGKKIIQNFFEIHNLTHKFIPLATKKKNQTSPDLNLNEIITNSQVQEHPWLEIPILLWKNLITKPYCFWLDSNRDQLKTTDVSQQERFSYMGVSERIWSLDKGSFFKKQKSNSWKKEILEFSSILDFLQTYQQKSKTNLNNQFPIQNGLVGFFDYASNVKTLDREQKSLWLEATNFFVWDHQEKRFFIYSSPHNDLAKILETTLKENSAINKPNMDGQFIQKRNQSFWENHPSLLKSLSKKQYTAQFLKIKNYLKEGQIYEMCLTNQFIYPYKNIDTVSLYKNLRDLIPAPYSAYLKTPEGSLISVSPELFFQISPQGHILTRPMKGSRQIETETVIENQKKKFFQSDKESSELLMITDLFRNDLSKICTPDSIKTQSLKSLTQWSNVLQLSSCISGEIEGKTTLSDIFNALYPSGSITGAPKTRATQFIQNLEPHKRNHYTGNIGYIGGDNSLCFNVAIRSLWINSNQVTFGAGGAITIESDLETEYREMWFKALPLLNILSKNLTEKEK